MFVLMDTKCLLFKKLCWFNGDVTKHSWKNI